MVGAATRRIEGQARGSGQFEGVQIWSEHWAHQFGYGDRSVPLGRLAYDEPLVGRPELHQMRLAPGADVGQHERVHPLGR